jgi:CRP/FNR family cyclic AMP-dependent transcriptional regulator
MNSENQNLDLEEIGIGSKFNDQLCQMLETITLFREFSRPELENLARYVRAYRARKNTTLLKEGGRDSFLCIIINGKVDILKEDADFHNKKLTTVRNGAVLGEISVIDGLPHSATAMTATDSEIVILSKRNLEQICEDIPKLGIRLLWRIGWQLCARLRQTSGQLIDHLT